MPPKSKDNVVKKSPAPVVRPIISDASLNYIPDNAIQGYQDRIELNVPWTLTEESARYHKNKCTQAEIPRVPFTEALQNKIKNSILYGFINESGLTLKEEWEVLLPIVLWDDDRFANGESAICFKNANSLTDNMLNLIKKAVYRNDREVLKQDLKMISVLRLIGTKMTELDRGLVEFKNLTTLNLCGNFLDDLKCDVIPHGLRMLELQANRIKNVNSFAAHLPSSLIYLGLGRNFLSGDSDMDLKRLPHEITVLDLSDNDIYNLSTVLDTLVALPKLSSLTLAGNPCAMCAAYAKTTIARLPNLQWLDSREILLLDRSLEPFEPHIDDLRSAYFNFTVFRVMSTPQPPKPDKGTVTAFHVELELPLLDSTRRMFLMFRQNESLIEILPPPEDDEWNLSKISPSVIESKTFNEYDIINMKGSGVSSHNSDIYNCLTTKNSREVCHYTVFESNKVQWNKIMNFQEPTLRIFCPDLIALRDTFRTVVTVRLIYSVTLPPAGKQSKANTKSASNLKASSERRVTLAAIKCALTRPDWSQPSQHFHWDTTLGTDEAISWGDGDLSALQYTLAAVKTPKGKPESDAGSTKQFPPDNLTCHFGFGIDTIRA